MAEVEKVWAYTFGPIPSFVTHILDLKLVKLCCPFLYSVPVNEKKSSGEKVTFAHEILSTSKSFLIKIK